MIVYVPGIDSDLLLLRWWNDLGQSGDLERAFSVTMTACGTFMVEMQRTTLVYESDERGIWFAAWYDRLLSAGSYGLWIRDDKRHRPEALVAVLESIHFGLERFPVLVLATMHEPVIAQAQRLGFQTMGTIPHLFDGEAAHIAWVDSDHFYPIVKRYEAIMERDAASTNGGPH